MRVIVLSSNGYVRFLPGFAACWERYWPGQPATVVCYDVLPPPLPALFDVVSLGPQDACTWSGGLARYLATLDDEVIALFLEDYWLVQPVVGHAVAELVEFMETSQPNVAKIDLTDDRLKFPHAAWGNWYRQGLLRADPHAPYLFSFQVALWRRTALLANLRDAEDPWEAERNGSERWKGRDDVLVLGTLEPPVVYSQVAKARKPDLLRHEKLPPDEFARLSAAGVLRSWGFPSYV